MTAHAATGDVDPSLLSAFFDQVVESAAHTADAAGGWQVMSLRIAGERIELRGTGPDAARLMRPLQHLREAGLGGPAIRIDVVTRVGELPATTWRWDELSYTRGDDLAFSFDPDRRVLVATSVAQQRAVVWFATDRIGAWELAAPLRPTLDRLLAPLGHTMVHAGSIGRDGNCVLLAGPGGSGKSTAVHAAMARGLETVGDDFVLLPSGQSHVVESIYSTARLARTSPSFDPARHTVEDDSFGNEKALVYLDDEHPAQFVRCQRAVALVVPTLTRGLASSLEPAATTEVLRALLPSSLLLADRQRDALGRLSALAGSLSTYRLLAGTDLDALVDAVASLLPGGDMCAS